MRRERRFIGRSEFSSQPGHAHKYVWMSVCVCMGVYVLVSVMVCVCECECMRTRSGQLCAMRCVLVPGQRRVLIMMKDFCIF